MRILADSVGKMPMNAFMATIAICGIINLGLFVKTHRFGPSMVVPGLREPTTLRLHKADNNYALAMAKRFCHEYYNWSYIGHMRAKMRAAYLCDEPTMELVVDAAKKKHQYYMRMLCTSNAVPDEAKVVEADEKEGRYVVEVEFTVKEWQSFIPTEYDVSAQIVLEKQDDLEKRPFLLQVTNYDFKAKGDPKVLDVDKNDEDRTMLAELEASGKIEDHRRESSSKYVNGARVELEDSREWEVDEAWMKSPISGEIIAVKDDAKKVNAGVKSGDAAVSDGKAAPSAPASESKSINPTKNVPGESPTDDKSIKDKGAK